MLELNQAFQVAHRVRGLNLDGNGRSGDWKRWGGARLSALPARVRRKKVEKLIREVRDARRATMGKVDKSDDGAWKETHEK